jgi:hypothetical protein
MPVLEPAVERLADVELELALGIQVVADIAFARTAILVAKEALAWPPVLPETLKRSQSVSGPDSAPSKICVS